MTRRAARWVVTIVYRCALAVMLVLVCAVGATGRFAGLEGTAIESYRLTDLDPASRSVAAVGELHLRLGEPQIAAGE